MKKQHCIPAALLGLAALAQAPLAAATIQGLVCTVSPCEFTLTAKAAHITLGDGNSMYTWGYADTSVTGSGAMQYPGPTLIVPQGATVNVSFNNTLPLPASIVFPGQGIVGATGGSPGVMTQESGSATDVVTYSFTASNPGTYQYYSGTRPELEVEMGLQGALIVRPMGFAEGDDTDHSNRRAYEGGSSAGVDAASYYDREYLFFLTEMDRSAHELVENIANTLADRLARFPASRPTFDWVAAGLALSDPALQLDPAAFAATLWFMNGRNGPDTLLQRDVEWLPHQPYNIIPRLHPGERLLMRVVSAGRDMHPLHHHGNNAWQIALNGELLQSGDGTTAGYPDLDTFTTANSGLSAGRHLPDQAVSNYTIQTTPGNTADAIFTWTGKGLGWDIYGHTGSGGPGAGCSAAAEPGEDLTNHCRTFAYTSGDTLPVILPEQQSLTFGGFWSGSAYLGTGEALPPLQGGLNPNSGYTFMWHSHSERELTNDDIFPGGMMTMLIVEAPTTPIID